MASRGRFPFVVLLFAGLALAAFLAPAARVPEVSPAYVPVGVSTSGNISIAWFHEESSGQTMACQTLAEPSGPAPIRCVAAKLP